MQREPELAPELQQLAHVQVPVFAQTGPDSTQGLRQATLHVLGLLEELKLQVRRPTWSPTGGHYKVKHTAFHLVKVTKVQRHMGFGNWTLSWTAYMMAPEIRSVFNSSKALGDMVESWLVVAESQQVPPACDDFASYLRSLAHLLGISSQRAHDELDWKSTPCDLVRLCRRHMEQPTQDKEAGDVQLRAQLLGGVAAVNRPRVAPAEGQVVNVDGSDSQGSYTYASDSEDPLAEVVPDAGSVLKKTSKEVSLTPQQLFEKYNEKLKRVAQDDARTSRRP